MRIEVVGIGGFILLVLNIWAIVSIVGSRASTGGKVIWGARHPVPAADGIHRLADLRAAVGARLTGVLTGAANRPKHDPITTGAPKMLQDFRRRTTPDTGAGRLAALRAAMAAEGVDAFLVPRADAHQGENVAARDERLAWLTGFTGSAGFAVVTRDEARALRRRPLPGAGALQADMAAFTVLDRPDAKPGAWLVEALPGGGRVGFDPWLHTAKEIETLTRRWSRADHAAPDREPRRPHLGRPAAAAGGGDRHPARRARRAQRRRQARRRRAGAADERADGRRPDAARFASPGS